MVDQTHTLLQNAIISSKLPHQLFSGIKPPVALTS
jgi:hypothetical protein